MKKTEGQVIQWPKEKDRRTDNTMAMFVSFDSNLTGVTR
jgi:hypothetical protein